MGGFVLIVGPSGAGKDTLLGLARQQLADETRLHFARRVITRAESAAEAHDTLDQAGFLAAQAAGAFCLHWQAHGLHYGIPARYAAAAQAGAVVVANVSRGVVAAARSTLPGVSAVEITAPAPILAARLAQRGRAEDGDLAARLARAAEAAVDLRILNDSTPEAAAAQLVQHLRARLAGSQAHPIAQGSAMTDPRLTRIAELLTLKAEGTYGLSAINQRQHALQAALLAEAQGCPEALIVACLLHDIGHMVHNLGENPAEAGVDDEHERLGQEFLAPWFGPEVTEPVRLHVAAKRYLCATEADYFARLSPDSVLSLSLQGGPMSAEEVAAFNALPQSAAAVQLRRFDEMAKVKGLQTPPVEHFMPYVARCILPA